MQFFQIQPKASILLLALAAMLLASCEGDDALDSNFKINPIKDKDAMLRSLFFAGDSVAFFEEGRPPVDTGRYGIQYVKTSKGDTLICGFTTNNSMSFVLNDKTPAGVKIKNLYLSYPGSLAYWKFGPARGTTDIRNISVAFPNNLMPGTFPLLVGATLEKLVRDTSNVLKPVRITVPEDTVIILLK